MLWSQTTLPKREGLCVSVYSIQPPQSFQEVDCRHVRALALGWVGNRIESWEM